MAILIDENSKVIVQGFTGQTGTFHSRDMINYGTNIVGGVTPGKGGTLHLDKPVFDTLKEAVTATGADSSIIFIPPPFAADGIMEAADAGIKYCVCISDGIPAHDMIRVKRYMRRYKAADKLVLTGPNCAGTISPGKAMLGIMPGHIYLPGRVGVIGRSGTLGYEAASQMKSLGIGVSTSVGIGGDPINGSSFKDHLIRFEQDPDTDAVVMIGEIGGPPGSGSRRILPGQHEKTGHRIYSGTHRAQRQAYGTLRRHYFRLRRERRRKSGDPAGMRRNRGHETLRIRNHSKKSTGVPMSRPRVVVSRKWPEEVESRMQEIFDVQLNADDIPMSVSQMHAALQTADAFCPPCPITSVRKSWPWIT